MDLSPVCSLHKVQRNKQQKTHETRTWSDYSFIHIIIIYRVLVETPEGRRIRGRSRRRLQNNIKADLKKDDRRTRDGLISFWTERSSVLVYK